MHVVQVSERERNLLPFADYRDQFSEVADGLAKHDLVVSFKGGIRRDLVVNLREARVRLVARTTACSSGHICILLHLVCNHGLHSSEDMVGSVHTGKVLLSHLAHHDPVLSDNPSADYLGAHCARE